MRGVSRTCIVLLAVMCLALQVQPEQALVEGGAGTDFEQVISLVNDQPRPVEVRIEPHRFSEYLNDAATLSDERVYLLPQETKNLQVRGTVPTDLGPETHHLRYQVREQGRELGSFVIDMPIAGNANLEPGLRVEAEDASRGSSLSADAVLTNFGNVIAYFNLSLQVREAGSVVDTITYPQAVQVLPGEEEDISLVYTGFLEPGDYVLRVEARVNGERTITESAPVRVLLSQERKEITAGEDLVVELKRYDTQPRIQYRVRRASSEVLSETLIAQEDELTIPTATLGPGEYEVEIAVTHQRGTDTQRFTLVISEAQAFAGWIGWLLGAVALLSALASRKLRLLARLLWLEARVHLREKRLNRLVYRAHELERRYGS